MLLSYYVNDEFHECMKVMTGLIGRNMGKAYPTYYNWLQMTTSSPFNVQKYRVQKPKIQDQTSCCSSSLLIFHLFFVTPKPHGTRDPRRPHRCINHHGPIGHDGFAIAKHHQITRATCNCKKSDFIVTRKCLQISDFKKMLEEKHPVSKKMQMLKLRFICWNALNSP